MEPSQNALRNLTLANWRLIWVLNCSADLQPLVKNVELLAHITNNLASVRILFVSRLLHSHVKLIETLLNRFVLVIDLFQFFFLTDAVPLLVFYVGYVFPLLVNPFLLLLMR